MSHRMVEDFGLCTEGLADKYQDDEQHPVIRLDDWRRAVRDRQTLLGYWQFVFNKVLDYQIELDNCNPYNQLMGER